MDMVAYMVLALVTLLMDVLVFMVLAFMVLDLEDIVVVMVTLIQEQEFMVVTV